MAGVHLVVGCALIALNLSRARVGGVAWYRAAAPRSRFWYLLRGAQAAVFLQALLGGLLVFTGHKPADNLHYLYGILPARRLLPRRGRPRRRRPARARRRRLRIPRPRTPSSPWPWRSSAARWASWPSAAASSSSSPCAPPAPAAASELSPAGGTRRRGRPAGRPRSSPGRVTSPVTITWSPPAITSRRSQAIQARAPSIAGMPSRSLQATPAHFSATGALVAKARAIGSWPACRTLTPKRLAACTASRVREPRSRQASISIGSIESEQTALAVAPAGPVGAGRR